MNIELMNEDSTIYKLSVALMIVTFKIKESE